MVMQRSVPTLLNDNMLFLQVFTNFILLRRIHTAFKLVKDKNTSRLLFHLTESLHNLTSDGIDTDIAVEDIEDYKMRLQRMILYTQFKDLEVVQDELENMLLCVETSMFMAATE